MIVTEDLYEENYCKSIDNKEWRYTVTPQTVKIIYDHFKPKSVIDVGCANGIHLKAFKDLGVNILFGIEGTKHWAPYIEKNFDGDYAIYDIRKPFTEDNISIRFDLVYCMEVLEHLEKCYANIAVDNLCKLGDTIIVSACPIRGGFHHLNPQPKSYWIKKFKKRGYKYCEDEVNTLQSKFKKINCSGWYKTGLKVFRHE